MNAGFYALAVNAQNAGKNGLALDRLKPVLANARESDDRRLLAQALNVRGNALAGLRCWPEAMASFQESARVAWRALAFYELAFAFWNLPRVLAHMRLPELAARVAAFAERYWLETGGKITPSDRRDQRRVSRLVACQLQAGSIDDSRREGRRWTLPTALAQILEP